MLIFGATELGSSSAETILSELRAAEMTRRARFTSPLHSAADAYLVRRNTGHTIVAGYPWFTDWGRDTFIALRGVCLAANRNDQDAAPLVDWCSSTMPVRAARSTPSRPIYGHLSISIAEARTRFLTPILRHLDEAGLGHISEIADGDAPHTANGCPSWSVGEALRLDRLVLAAHPVRNRRRRSASKGVEGAIHEMGV